MEVKWIKIVTDIFDDEKIKIIESMPEADTIIVIWFKVLCLAGRSNSGGALMLTDRICYTDEMLAAVFRRPLPTVRMALSTFQSLGMVEIIDNTVTIPSWSKHQFIDKLEARKEYDREYKRRQRQQQKLLSSTGCQVDSQVDSPMDNVDIGVDSPVDVHSLDIDIDKDIEREKEKEREKECSSSSSGNPFSNTNNEDNDGILNRETQDRVVKYVTEFLPMMTPNNLDELLSYRDDMSDEMIIYAIDVAAANSAKSYAYIRRILNRYVEEGYKTLGDIRHGEEKFQAQSVRGMNGNRTINPALNYQHSDSLLDAIKDLGKDFFVDLDGDDKDGGAGDAKAE